MKTGKIEVVIIILTVSCLALTALFVFRQTNKSSSKEGEQCAEHLFEMEHVFRISFENNDKYLSDTLKLRTTDGHVISMKDVAARHRVIYRYTSMNCGACVDKEFNVFKQALGKTKHPELFCLLVTGHGKRDVAIKLKLQGINCSMYFIDQTDIGVSIDSYSLPYYFCLNSDLRISGVFVPVTWNPALSEYYLQTMLSKEQEK